MRRIVCILVTALVPATADAQQQPKPEWAFPVTEKVQPKPRFAPDRVRTVGPRIGDARRRRQLL